MDEVIISSQNLVDIDQKAKLDLALDELRQKEWSGELKSSGITENQVNATRVLQEFSEGIIDVVEAMQKRERLPGNYKLPEVGISQYKTSSYEFSIPQGTEITDETTELTKSKIGMPKSVLIDLANQGPNDVYGELVTDPKTGKDVLLRLGTSSQVGYAIGVEEGAHSIFVRDRINRNQQIKPGDSVGENELDQQVSYYSSDIEYHGLGWRVRTILDGVKSGKISDEEAQRQISPYKDMILRAAKFRSEHRSVREDQTKKHNPN